MRSSCPPPTSGTSSPAGAAVVVEEEVVEEVAVVVVETVAVVLVVVVVEAVDVAPAESSGASELADGSAVDDVVLEGVVDSVVAVDSVDGFSVDGVAESICSAPPHAAATRDIARRVPRRWTEFIVRL